MSLLFFTEVDPTSNAGHRVAVLSSVSTICMEYTPEIFPSFIKWMCSECLLCARYYVLELRLWYWQDGGSLIDFKGWWIETVIEYLNWFLINKYLLNIYYTAITTLGASDKAVEGKEGKYPCPLVDWLLVHIKLQILKYSQRRIITFNDNMYQEDII